MSKRSNEKKNEQLGMPFGTATNRMRKRILFSLVQAMELADCYRCGDKIESVEEFSIEHKTPWLDSEDPVELFFDLDNIAFSHLSCNCKVSRGRQPRESRVPHGKDSKYHMGCRCNLCRSAHAEAKRNYMGR